MLPVDMLSKSLLMNDIYIINLSSLYFYIINFYS